MVQKYFELKIDYKQNTRNPEIIFDSMAKMIRNMRSLDEMMVESLPTITKVEIELEFIEIGSIKARLTTVLEAIPDSAIENLEWKNFVGSYLLKAKYYAIEKLADKKTLTRPEEVRALKEGIEQIGYEELGENVSISQTKLLENLCNLSDTMKQLDKEDKVIYICGSGAAVINKSFDLKMSQIEELISTEIKEVTSDAIVQIKKPDYLGSSKWELYCEGQVITAKILDFEWLMKYQNGDIDIRPKDSLKILLKAKYSRDDYGRISHTTYEVYKVREVIRVKEFEQFKMNN